jgi:hypothetical protein
MEDRRSRSSIIHSQSSAPALLGYRSIATVWSSSRSMSRCVLVMHIRIDAAGDRECLAGDAQGQRRTKEYNYVGNILCSD